MSKIDKELEAQVANVVANLFNEKEEEAIRKKTEDELIKAASSISDLTEALEAKNSELSGKNEELSDALKVVADKEAEIASIKAELEAAKAETEAVKVSLEGVSTELSNVKKDIVAEKRMVELESAGVAHTDKKQEQSSKVREMSDEDFDSYKSELSSIREAIVKELEADRKQKEEAAAAAATAAASVPPSAEKASEKDTNDTDVDPANITFGQASAAALNMEYLPSDDVLAKYNDLGKAMAEFWKKS